MICVSLSESDALLCLDLLRLLPFAEIRLDLAKASEEYVRTVFSSSTIPLMATCRLNISDGIKEEVRAALLCEALESGASYVDLELDASEVTRKMVMDAAHRSGAKIIFSYHNLRFTPELSELVTIKETAFSLGADLVKIACMVRSPKESVRLLAMLDDTRPVLPVGLGPLGLMSRVLAPILGSPFTFACLEPGRETAPGQPDYVTLQALIQRYADVFR